MKCEGELINMTRAWYKENSFQLIIICKGLHTLQTEQNFNRTSSMMQSSSGLLSAIKRYSKNVALRDRVRCRTGLPMLRNLVNNNNETLLRCQTMQPGRTHTNKGTQTKTKYKTDDKTKNIYAKINDYSYHIPSQAMTINSSALRKMTDISVYILNGDLAYNVSLAQTTSTFCLQYVTQEDVLLSNRVCRIKALISRHTSLRLFS